MDLGAPADSGGASGMEMGGRRDDSLIVGGVWLWPTEALGSRVVPWEASVALVVVVARRGVKVSYRICHFSLFPLETLSQLASRWLVKSPGSWKDDQHRRQRPTFTCPYSSSATWKDEMDFSVTDSL